MRKIILNTKELTSDKADFLTSQCEKSLQRTLDDRDAIQKKGTFVLGILSAIIAFGVNLFIKNMNEWSRPTLIFVALEIILLVILSLPIIWGYLPSLYAGHGYDPSKIIKNDYINQDLAKMKIGYAHELQYRITYNRRWNEKTSVRLKQITSAVFLSPIIVLIIIRIFGCLLFVS
jgi:hypothetical protein